ncbi:MAG TPA: hypothetical protein VGE47_12155, partial [Burkholderiaceae bacterium]
MKISFPLALLCCCALALAQPRGQIQPAQRAASLATASAYQQPSAAIREALNAPALPRLVVSPDKQTLALLELRRFNTLEELARPTLRLAGLHFDAQTDTQHPPSTLLRLRLRALQSGDAAERVIELPQPGFHSFAWAPDGQRFLLERRDEQGNELWVGETASGRLRQIGTLHLNNMLGQDEMAWLNPHEVVVLGMPKRRTPPREVPLPVVQEHQDRASPERSYPDLLKSPYDEALFEYHARSQLVLVDLASGGTRDLGEPALFSSLSSVGAAGGAQYLLTERLLRPFSYRLTWDDFAQSIEVRQRDGRVLRELARLPMKDGVAIDGVLPGPRVFYASPTADAAVYWVEALDGGNPAARVAFRDRVMRLDPPFIGEPVEVQRMPQRFTRLRFLDDGQHALLTETDRLRAWTRTYLLPLNGTQSKPLFEHSVRERYRHPGTPLMRTLANGHSVIQSTREGEIFLIGQGANPRGERPFLDKFSIRDLSSQRLFQSSESAYEMPLMTLAAGDSGRLLLQRESPQ